MTNSFSKSEIDSHNERLEAYAADKAQWLRAHPTNSERQMKEFLTNQGIKFAFKRVFYIRDNKNFIRQYHIVDFFLPDSNTVITMGYKSFSDKNSYDKLQFGVLTKNNLRMRLLHWCPEDFKSYHNMKLLLSIIKPKEKKALSNEGK